MQLRCSIEHYLIWGILLFRAATCSRVRSVAFSFACAVLLVGCQSVKVRDEPYFNTAVYAKQPPVSVAIAPLKNSTQYEEAHLMMRRSLYSSIAPLGFSDIELDEVDQFVAKQAMERNREPSELDRWYLAQPDLADAVIFGEVKDVSRLFLIFYSSIRVDVQLELVDTRTKTVTYSNDFRVVNRQFNLPSSIFGIGSSMFTSLWHMRGDQIGTSMKETADVVSERMDRTIGESVALMGSVAKVTVQTRQKHIRAGDEVRLEVTAPEGMRLEFSIGEVARALPLTETRPGIYEGVYKVKPGDNAKFAYASVMLFDAPQAESGFVFSAEEQAFELDTTPPGTYVVDKWGTTPQRRGLTLQIAPVKPNSETAAKLHVFRRTAGAAGDPTWLGLAEGNSFTDSSALAGSRYEYMIIAEDAAGNRSAPEARFVTIPGEVANSSSTP